MAASLHIEPPRSSQGWIHYSATLRPEAAPPHSINLKLPETYRASIGHAGSAFLTLSLFTAMRVGGQLHVDAPVCPILRKNLSDFSVAWSQWAPDLYKPLQISAVADCETTAEKSDRILVPFSGGLDSCHNVMKLIDRDSVSMKKNLSALIVHGFDIPLEDLEGFHNAERNAREILDSVGVELITMSCDIRQIPHHWENEHGAALAGCLHLFDGQFTQALVAGSHSYSTLRFPWGSNPLTDPLLSSGQLAVRYAGLAYSRNMKAKELAGWPEAMERIRTCWQVSASGQNCGLCIRCIATALCFASEGIRPPDILNVGNLSQAVDTLGTIKISKTALQRLEDSILVPARSNQLSDAWVGKLEKLLRHRKRRLLGKQIRRDVRNFIRYK